MTNSSLPFCPDCGARNRPGALFCSACGRGLTRLCPSCGAALKTGSRFCDACGRDLGTEAASAQAQAPAPAPALSSAPSGTGQYSADGSWWWNGTQWVSAQGTSGPSPTAAAAATPSGRSRGRSGWRRQFLVPTVLIVVFGVAFALSWLSGLVIAAVGLGLAALTWWNPGGAGRAVTGFWATLRLPGVRAGTAGRAAAVMVALSLVLVPGTIGGLGAFGYAFVTNTQEVRLSGRACVATPLTKATVNVYEAKSDGQAGTLLTTAVTDEAGYYTASVQGHPSSFLLVRTSGGSYVDATSATALKAGQDESLQTILRAGSGRVALTPLTTFAAVRAESMASGGQPLDASVEASYAAIERQFNLETISAVDPAVANDATDILYAGRVARQHGLILAGLNREANALGVSAFALANAVALDLSDGTLDGKHGSTAILIGGKVALPADAATAKLQEAIDAFASTAGNATHLPAPQISLEAPQLDLNTGGLAYVSPNVLPAWIDGNAAQVSIGGKGGTKPYKCALESGELPKGFSILEDCTLKGDGTPILGSNPMLISTPFTVRMSDSSGPPQVVSFSLRATIIAKPPTITVTNGACPQVGKKCTVKVASATGGTPPYYFEIGSFMNGTPPPGMTVLLGGTLSGWPSRKGPYNFQVCVVDLFGATDCDEVRVTVGEATPESTQNSLPSGFPTDLPSGTYKISMCSEGVDAAGGAAQFCVDVGTFPLTNGDASVVVEAISQAGAQYAANGATVEYTAFNGTYFDMVITEDFAGGHYVHRIHVVKVG
jgi:hypothetical protein